MPSEYRVWWKDEFDQCKSQEELDDIAWKVPDEEGLLDPTRRIPCDDPEDAARKYAEYFYYERDGYEDSWPLDFVVHDGDKYEVVNVLMEYEPSFTSADPKPIMPAFATEAA